MIHVVDYYPAYNGLKDASSDLERCGEIVDFQNGGPTMSPLLLIYMYWKSNGFYWGKPFHPASSPSWVDIWSYPYDIIGSDMGLMQVCGG